MQTGWTVARRKLADLMQLRNEVLDCAAIRFVPFAVEMCWCTGEETVRTVNRLDEIPAGIGHVP